MKESIAIIVNTITGIGLSIVGIIGLVVHDVSIPIALFVFLLIIGIIKMITKNEFSQSKNMSY